MKAGLRLTDLTLRRGQTTVFERLDLALTEPRVGLIGDNGAGKSSLLRLLCGLEQPQGGRVEVDGTVVDGTPPPPGRIGLMFQNPDEQIIFPTVEEELALGPQAAGASRRDAKAAAHEALRRRGLADWAPRAIASLSHGQRQFVCWLALDLAAPRVRLLDEPYASLDLPGQAWLREEIRRAPAQVLVSSHLLGPLRDFDRVIWLERGAVRADGAGAEVCAAYEADVARRIADRPPC
ncbi:energy-coupling factor ABC transporter ATP-binding protein [Sphaerotilus mobilis]|uniref:Biotin transport system ATP-binding protein n=1 Tax=Sphaerotilus mobilis TaxID=47994 RepID=A0A4Q7LF82_9BURK|nr:ABC transporter ATP-binding protein [Sphaerotilus mobilis]RZS52247.1 biotin transport system ATP-binding protein [Sphaerotilus mobilis]